MADRQTIVTTQFSFPMTRRLMNAEGATNLQGFEAIVKLELMGPINETSGRLISSEDLNLIIEEEITDNFTDMMVLKYDDPLMETLVNKPLINNNGWKALLNRITLGINAEGFYNTTRQVYSPFYDGQHPLAVAEHPTAENLSYLIHRILSVPMYEQGVQQMKVTFTEAANYSAVFLGDVRPTPDFPQVPVAPEPEPME